MNVAFKSGPTLTKNRGGALDDDTHHHNIDIGRTEYYFFKYRN